MFTYSEDMISDLHKEARGYRPTEAFWNAWNFQDEEGKQTAWNVLVDELKEATAAKNESRLRVKVVYKGEILYTDMLTRKQMEKLVVAMKRKGYDLEVTRIGDS